MSVNSVNNIYTERQKKVRPESTLGNMYENLIRAYAVRKRLR